MTDIEVVIKALRQQAKFEREHYLDDQKIQYTLDALACLLEMELRMGKPTVQPEQDQEEERK